MSPWGKLWLSSVEVTPDGRIPHVAYLSNFDPSYVRAHLYIVRVMSRLEGMKDQ